MNRVFRLVLNRAIGMYVAVAECVRSKNGMEGESRTKKQRPDSDIQASAWFCATRMTHAVFLAFALPAVAHAQSLITNGDFSTGNFTGWTQSGNTDWTSVSCAGAAPYNCYADIGPVGSLGYLTQTFTAVAGNYLKISYAFQNDGATPNVFQVSFNSNYLFNMNNGPASIFTPYYFYVQAAASNTLEFGFQDDPGFQQLTNISVLDVGATAPGPLGQPIQQSSATNIDSASMSAAGLASGTLNPVFDGGTLQLDGTTSLGSTYNFSITSNNGTIDLAGNSASIATPITNDSAAPGSLTIANTGIGGVLTLSAVNTYTGSTTINSGATLALSGSGSIASSSGVTVNGSFDITGTTSGTSITTLSGAGTVLTSNGKSLTLTNAAGTFSGAITGAGSLIIASGTETLSGTNTLSGGIVVDAGAALSISSANAVGSGTLALVGSAFVPATLQTTASMTLSNALTVEGDPVFNVAPSTTLTVSSPITDGGSTGDVVVSGGGTLNLTASNTYTGPTTIDSGSTLALTGNSASIATSSAVINNGTFDLRNANPTTVSLNGTYTQGGTGTLNLVASAPSTFQKLTVAGAATLGGTLDLTAAAGRYAIGRYVLVDATGGRSGTFSTFSTNLASVTSLGFLLGYNSTQAYLDLTPASDATLLQIAQNASRLRTAINNQAAALQTALTYDCSVFDSNNLCVSAGGRYTSVGEGSVSNFGGMVALGYRPTSNTRIGVFVDQTLDNTNTSTVSQSKNQPTFGLFGNWALNADGLGLNVRGSAVFSSSDLTIKRQASDTTEGGQGKTSFNGQAYEVRLNYVKPLSNSIAVTPYVGLRYTRVAMGDYSESGIATSWPVRYRGMAQDALSAVAGANIALRLMDNLTANAGLGVQQNLHYRMGDYAGTSDIPGVAAFTMPMAGKTDTLATASAGATYNISAKERIGINAYWQQQPSYSRGTSSVMATWSMGF